MFKTALLYAAVAVIIVGCYSRGDVVARVKAGDSISEITVSGRRPEAPISFTITDSAALKLITDGVREAENGLGDGFAYYAWIRLASGYREGVSCVVERGGTGMSFGVGGGILRDSTYYRVGVGRDAPACLVTNLALLGNQ